MDIRSDPNEALAEILAAIEPRDRSRCLLDPLEDVLSIADLSVAHPVLEFPECLGITLDMVKDEKTLDSRLLRKPRRCRGLRSGEDVAGRRRRRRLGGRSAGAVGGASAAGRQAPPA